MQRIGPSIFRLGNRRFASAALVLAVELLITIGIPGCKEVEISRTKPWWEEVQFNADDQTSSPFAGSPAVNPSLSSSSANEAGRTPLVIENPDGSVILNSPLPQNLISNLYTALIQEKYDLVLDQLVAAEAKETYENQDRDPVEIAEWLQEHRRDVVALLIRMNRGLNSPDVVWTQRGNTFRLKLTGRTAQGMRYTTLDLAREGTQFRLVLIK